MKAGLRFFGFTLAALAAGSVGCTANSVSDSPASAGPPNGDRGGMLGKADGMGLPGSCGTLTSGQSSDGCYCDDECCGHGDCCADDRAASCSAPTIAGPSKPRLEIGDGRGAIFVDGNTAFDGTLMKDGTAGMSYYLVAEEGWVCGRILLSKWDPFNEGDSLGNEVSVSWDAPDGSVASTCAPEMRPLEGIYKGSSSLLAGTFEWSRPMRGDYTMHLIEGFGTLSYKGQPLLEGRLERDGSAGMSYELVPEEGFVCGTFYLSKWDPNSEGLSLLNAVNVTWRAPDGSVKNQCNIGYHFASGIYDGTTDDFTGVYMM